MIEKMKRASETAIAKFLLALITLSFVFFGFTNDFTGSGNIALKVADKSVSIQELDLELRRQIDQFKQKTGIPNFNYKQALQMGLVDQIINNMTYRLLLDAEAKDEGILVSDDKIYEIIKNTKDFQDDKGNFSPERFAYILDQNNITEHKFIEEISNDIARQILMNAITSNIDHSYISELLYKNKNEKRVFDVVSFKIENEKISSKPTDLELKEIYDANKDTFSQPEYRKISYITITPEMAMKFRNIKKTDDDKIYRTMIEMGENVIDEINGGAKINEIAKTFGITKTMLPDLDVEGKKRDGSIFKDKTFTQKYRDIAFFALDENGISDVLDNGDNVMLVMVEKVYPSAPKSFENVKNEIRKMWLKNAQVAQAQDKLNKISSALSNGEKFTSVVKKVDANANVLLNSETGRFNNLYTSDFLTKLFSNEIGKPFTSQSKDVYYVAILRDIKIPEITNKNDFAKFHNQEKTNFANMIVDNYISYLYKKHGVKRNEKVIQRLFN
ncbi:MAG: SurA N-terminal domain-containing protein [Alphaproteobacteria bacterium]|nr:SurA N-terminal domain-containing protein [Alphaproteobacteria bacterium]